MKMAEVICIQYFIQVQTTSWCIRWYRERIAAVQISDISSVAKYCGQKRLWGVGGNSAKRTPKFIQGLATGRSSSDLQSPYTEAQKTVTSFRFGLSPSEMMDVMNDLNCDNVISSRFLRNPHRKAGNEERERKVWANRESNPGLPFQ